jgi:hypothetical protein
MSGTSGQGAGKNLILVTETDKNCFCSYIWCHIHNFNTFEHENQNCLMIGCTSFCALVVGGHFITNWAHLLVSLIISVHTRCIYVLIKCYRSVNFNWSLQKFEWGKAILLVYYFIENYKKINTAKHCCSVSCTQIVGCAALHNNWIGKKLVVFRCLFNDAVSNSDEVVSNCGMIVELVGDL